MQELNIIKQIVQLAFTSGKISNLEEIKTIVLALDKLDSKLQEVDHKIMSTPIHGGN